MKNIPAFTLHSLLAVLLISCGNHVEKNSASGQDDSNGHSVVQPQQTYSISKKPSARNGDKPSIHFLDATQFNFGTIKNGESVLHVFHFVNKGSTPLIIENAYSTCGCTVASFPRKPILPNATDSVVATFNSVGNGLGVKNKVVTIISNSKTSPDLVTLIGQVK